MSVTRDRVVHAALAVLDETGLEGLTLKRVADNLGVRAPTLYWHVENKQALLDEMATAMLREHDWTIEADTWQTWLTTAARELRAMLLRHRDGAKVFSGSHLTDDSALTLMERPLRVLADAGFPPDEAARAWALVYTYVIGFTIEEQSWRTAPPDRRYDPEARATRVDETRYPLTHQAGEVLFADFPRRFEHGLTVIVRGLATT